MQLYAPVRSSVLVLWMEKLPLILIFVPPPKPFSPQGVFPASFVHLKEVVIEKRGLVEWKVFISLQKLLLLIYFSLYASVRLQKWGGGDVSRDAPGEGGDHHTEGVGKHMEAALCGKKKIKKI